MSSKQKILKEIDKLLTDFKGDSAFSDDVDGEYKKHLLEIINQALDTMKKEGKKEGMKEFNQGVKDGIKMEKSKTK